MMKKPAKPVPFRYQCRAVIVQLVIETVDGDGEVIAEALMEPRKVLRSTWASLPDAIAQVVAQINAAQKES